MLNLIIFLRKSRNIKNLISRAVTILQRFSFSPKKLEKTLIQYIELLRKFKLSPTFSATAIILERYPDIIKTIQNKEAKLAIHGYSHIDYLVLPLSEIQKHLNKAKKIFSEYGIPFTGFRAPYTRWNNLQILKESGFSWDSSQTILWNVLNPRDSSYLQAIKLYNPINADSSLSLPSFPLESATAGTGPTSPVIASPENFRDEAISLNSNFVEIPLSLPDDEMLIDRLKLSKKEIKRVWTAIFRETYKRGELFTLQVHHERFPFCSSIIEALLKTASSLPVWLANLEEIAQWWQEKATFSAEFKNDTIKFNCSTRATILLRNITTQIKTKSWPDGIVLSERGVPNSPSPKGWKAFPSSRGVSRRDGVFDGVVLSALQTVISPIIGVKDCSYEFISFLKQEGYILEEAKNTCPTNGRREDNYALYFENVTQFNKLEVIAQIENSNKPLVRFWRWPYNKRSAFSITGDIDTLTLFDFFARIAGK